jgi:hypothetical protein
MANAHEKTLAEIEAYRAAKRRLAIIEYRAHCREAARQFAANPRGLLIWLAEGHRRPRQFTSLDTAISWLTVVLRKERALLLANDRKAHGEFIPALHQRLLVARYLRRLSNRPRLARAA